MKLAIVTATLDFARALPCVGSWIRTANGPIGLYLVEQGSYNADWQRSHNSEMDYCVVRSREIQGVVPAFAVGVARALADGAPIIACLHDDLEIEQSGWDEDVVRIFKTCPKAGLCGFGGAKGLGSDDLYQTPYDPMQLARQGFRSNMRHAEAHGIRSEVAEPVACLDGFSQVGLADFWMGLEHAGKNPSGAPRIEKPDKVALGPEWNNLFAQMQSWGVTHHFYDGMLGCFAKRLGWQVWYLPVACMHYGGQTAVADPRYHQWANRYAQQTDRLEGIEEEGTGDQIFWLRSHRIGYEQFKDVLPIRT